MAVVGGFSNVTKVPELRRRIGFTLMILAIYRVGVFITTPGVDRSVMRAVVRGQSGLLGLFNLFSGGAVANLSIFALGIMPYVSASIILQLLTMVFKPLDELRKEGEQGQRKINQYTRYGTVVISCVQSIGIAMWLESQNGPDGVYRKYLARQRRRLTKNERDMAVHDLSELRPICKIALPHPLTYLDGDYQAVVHIDAVQQTLEN